MRQRYRRLTDRQVRNRKPGLYGDGDCLYLRVHDSGARGWIYRYQANGRRVEMGLGGFPEVSLLDARQACDRWNRLRRVDGQDPLTYRRAERAGANTPRTFAEVGDDYIEAHRARWAEGHAHTWTQSLKHHVYPMIGQIPARDITTEHILRTLKPIWLAKNPTARRARLQIETVLNAAAARGLIDAHVPNPARWKGHLELLLPHRPTKTQHMVAMAHARLPAFMVRLRDQESIPARCMMVLILTATRTNEARLAQWCEFDLEAGTWTIPSVRVKARKDHVVPLSSGALDLVRAVPRLHNNPYVFTGMRYGQPIAHDALRKVLDRLREPVTVHGFRSAFRDWCAESRIDRDLAEECLGHTVGDAVERAYRRTNLLELRRDVLAKWDRYLSAEPATVVRIRARKWGEV